MRIILFSQKKIVALFWDQEQIGLVAIGQKDKSRSFEYD
jgi:hypothetical protein